MHAGTASQHLADPFTTHEFDLVAPQLFTDGSSWISGPASRSYTGSAAGGGVGRS